jgi:hypothetical protein
MPGSPARKTTCRCPSLAADQHRSMIACSLVRPKSSKLGTGAIFGGSGITSSESPVDELTQRALGRYSVIVIGAEPRLSYNRVLLSSLLAGDVGETALELKPRGWWNRHGVTTLDGQAVASIDRRGRWWPSRTASALPFRSSCSRPARCRSAAEARHGSAKRPHLPRSRRCRRDACLDAAGRPRGGDRRRPARH